MDTDDGRVADYDVREIHESIGRLPLALTQRIKSARMEWIQVSSPVSLLALIGCPKMRAVTLFEFHPLDEHTK